MKTQHQLNIEEFMRLAEQELPQKPVIPSLEVRKLRAALILEEAFETVKALGIAVLVDGLRMDYQDIVLQESYLDDPNLPEIVDGCADLSVVTIGTLSACGVHDLPVLNEVDASNLRKFSGDAHKDENGKWIKPTGFKHADIERVLREQST